MANEAKRLIAALAAQDQIKGYLANLRAPAEDRARRDMAVLPNVAVMLDDCPGIDDGPVTDLRAGTNDRPGPDVDSAPERNVPRDGRRPVDDVHRPPERPSGCVIPYRHNEHLQWFRSCSVRVVREPICLHARISDHPPMSAFAVDNQHQMNSA